MKRKKRAYISVYNKDGIVEFCRYLSEYGYQLIATEGTYKTLTDAGVKAVSAHELTGYPEPLGGKVRAVHPAIYTGIVANQLKEDQLNELDEKEIYPIELVVINLYPFKNDMEAGVPFEEAAAHMDTGGVALLDAAAKNFMRTVAVCDPDDYERLLCDLAAGAISEEERRYFMYKAFSCTASYNALIAQYLSFELNIMSPKTFTMTYEKAQDMRYGENPQQKAAVYREPLLKEGSLARAKQLKGGVLTYNNIKDANTAIELVKELECPAVVACKHCAPCGVGTGENLYDAFMRAYEADPLKFYRVVLAVNGIVDARIAGQLKDIQADLVVAVGFTPEAMAELHYTEKMILLEMPDIRSKVQFTTLDLRKIYGGVLVQSYDMLAGKGARCVTECKPTEAQIKALMLCYKIAKHAPSSAVVVGGENAAAGICAGQPDVNLALRFALELAGSGEGRVLASDSELPDADCVDLCHAAGIAAIIQTGNADVETVARCNRYRIAMLYTDERHLKN